MLLSVFVIISYNYKRMVVYKVPNGVGKITREVYTKHIFPTITPELIKMGPTLVQDADCVHAAKAIIKWAKDNSPSLPALLGNRVKKKFFDRRTRIEKAGIALDCHAY